MSWLNHLNIFKKDKAPEIPQNILQDLENLENEIKIKLENGEKKIDPYQIMWEYSNKKRMQGGLNGKENQQDGDAEPIEPDTEYSEYTRTQADIRGDATSISPDLPTEPRVSVEGSDEVGGSIQDRSIEEPKQNSTGFGKGFFRKRRSKTVEIANEGTN